MDRERLVKYAMPYDKPQTHINRAKLGPFVEGYIETALLESRDESFFGGGERLIRRFSRRSIAEPTLKAMIRDCLYFEWRNRAALQMLYMFDDYNEHGTGEDLWRSRNKIEPGFICRGKSELWDELHTSALGFGPCWLWIRDGEVSINIQGPYMK